jgi:predicted DsbA family dithiol-disulfide isomerase
MDEIRKNAQAGQRKTAKALEEGKAGKKRTNQSHMKTVDPVLFNDWAEEEFVGLVRELIGENPSGRIKKAEVLRECAYELKISTETVKRYLFKHTARKAEFREFDSWVFLNPKYVPRDEFGEEKPEEVTGD